MFFSSKKELCLYLVYILILIFVLEQISRIFIDEYQRSIIIYDDQLIWKYAPNLRIKNSYITSFAVNSLGFRDLDRPFKKENNSTRILVIGDSYTVGLYIPEKDTFPKYLEAKLNQNNIQKFEVFNFGVTGYATDQEYILLRNIGLAYDPDIVVLTVAPNDIRESFVKNLFYLNGGDLVLNKSNKAFNLDLKNKFFWSLSTKSQIFFIFQKIFGGNYGTFKYIEDEVIEGLFFKNNGGFDHPDKVLFLKNETDEMKDAILLFTALIEEMNNLCRTNNIKFIIVNLPIKLQFDGSLDNESLDTLKIQKILKNITSKNNIALLDLYHPIKDAANPLDYYIDEEYHLDQGGHRLVGDELYKFLIDKVGVK